MALLRDFLAGAGLALYFGAWVLLGIIAGYAVDALARRNQ